MVELAIAGNPAFELSRVELDRDGPSFTAETVELVAADEAHAGHDPDLHFILSAEAFAGFLTWNEPARVLAISRLVVLPREGHPPPDLEALATALPGLVDRVTVLDGPRIRLSASEIRARAGRGLSVRYLVPEAVRAYIAERRRLYRSPGPGIVEALRRLDVNVVVKLHDRSAEPTATLVDSIPATSQRRRVASRARTAPDRAELVAAARAERPPLEVARRIVDLAEDKKAADIVLLDLAGLTTLADYFVICSGGSERQLGGIADGIVDALRAEGVRPIGRECEPASHWILGDFGSVIVHAFTPPERE
jgi:ribosome silencing factor RsfS/YbeB/iojap/nicotinate (nicotinamide) nucleotide adenylyltransferase